MIIALGADHGGFPLKKVLTEYLRKLGYTVDDFGTHSEDAVDYPDYARAVAQAIREKNAERGILICGSGVGASVAANKMPGIRAGLCHDTYSAHQGVEHDDMNVLVLGSRVIGAELAHDLARAYLAAQFSGESRHVRRLEKVRALEMRFQPGPH